MLLLRVSSGKYLFVMHLIALIMKSHPQSYKVTRLQESTYNVFYAVYRVKIKTSQTLVLLTDLGLVRGWYWYTVCICLSVYHKCIVYVCVYIVIRESNHRRTISSKNRGRLSSRDSGMCREIIYIHTYVRCVI